MKTNGVKCQYRNYARAKIACRLCRAGAVSTKLNVLTREKTIGLYLPSAERYLLLTPFNSIHPVLTSKNHLHLTPYIQFYLPLITMHTCRCRGQVVDAIPTHLQCQEPQQDDGMVYPSARGVHHTRGEMDGNEVQSPCGSGP